MTLVGTTGTGQLSGAGSLSPSWGSGQVCTAGHTLFALVTLVNSTSSVPTCSTPSGWTLDASFDEVNGSNHLFTFWFRKIASGGDSAPSFTVSGGTSATAICELIEWDEKLTLDVLFSGAGRTTTGGPLSTGTNTTTNAKDVIFAGAGGRGATTFTWGGSLSDIPTDISTTISSVGIGSAIAYETVTTIQSSVSFSCTYGGTSNLKSILAVAYKRPVPISGGAAILMIS